jgi:hypothetical protein
MSMPSIPSCGNPYCNCGDTCECEAPCTCGLELVGEETVTEWDAEVQVLVHTIVAKYAPTPAAVP